VSFVFDAELEKSPGVSIARVSFDDLLAELHKLCGFTLLGANRIKLGPRFGVVWLLANGLLMASYQPVSEVLLHNP
jgi:hypothetical protein